MPWDRQLPQVPEVKAQMVGSALAAGARGPTTLRIAVEIPPDHHGYLDEGDDGVLIKPRHDILSTSGQLSRLDISSGIPLLASRIFPPTISL